MPLAHAWISLPWSVQWSSSVLMSRSASVFLGTIRLALQMTPWALQRRGCFMPAVLLGIAILLSLVPFWFSFHLWKVFVLLMLFGTLQVLPWKVSSFSFAHFLLFSSSISKGGSRKTPSGRVAESLRYRKKTSVRCSNLRRRLHAWTRSSSQVPGGSTTAVQPQLNAFFFQHILQGIGNV